LIITALGDERVLTLVGKLVKFGIYVRAIFEAAWAREQGGKEQELRPDRSERRRRGSWGKSFSAKMRSMPFQAPFFGIAVFVRGVIWRRSSLNPAAAVAAARARERAACVIVGVSSRRHLQEIANAWN
jgi:hypothetical protein